MTSEKHEYYPILEASHLSVNGSTTGGIRRLDFGSMLGIGFVFCLKLSKKDVETLIEQLQYINEQYDKYYGDDKNDD